jgi:signal transduction histidine kinase
MNRDTLTIIGITAGACAAVGVAGMATLTFTRHWPLRRSVVLATLLPVVAVIVAVLVNVQAMFISAHDSVVVLVALAVSGVFALVSALLIGRSLTLGTRALGAGLASLTDSGADPVSDHVSDRANGSHPAEIATLAAELEQTRAQLSAARERERAVEQSRRELVAFMSHDLRTPLAGVRALAEALEDDVVEDVPAALRQLQVTVDRMSGLVDDLFELSRLTTDPQPRSRRLVSMVEIVDDIVSELEAAARRSGVRLVADLPAGPERLAVSADAEELTRAVTNLVANGIRHTPPGGTVRLVAGRGEDRRVRIAVEDGCGGIASGDLERVFDVGWRADPDRGSPDHGAGLGLAISRGLVELHEGSIAVGNIAAGCRFTVLLPPAAAPA